MTVAAVRTELEASGQIAQSDQLLGEDGKWYTNKRTAVAAKPAILPRHRQLND